MMGSVSDLLQLARVRELETLPVEPVSVTDLLRETASDFSLPATVEGIALGDQHLCCPKIMASAQLLHRVLCNFVSNAIKHNGPGTKVWLDARVDESEGEIVFSCRDDGAGIPSEVLPSIFDEFAITADPLSGSTGLGLAFCKGAVEAHGGRIWCENLSRGALFSFAIPLQTSEVSETSEVLVPSDAKLDVGSRSRAGVRQPVAAGIEAESVAPPDCRWALFTG